MRPVESAETEMNDSDGELSRIDERPGGSGYS
jgi:hypothetical protein